MSYQPPPGPPYPGYPPPMPPQRPSAFAAARANFQRMPMIARVLVIVFAVLVVCGCLGVAASAGNSNKTANATATSAPQTQATHLPQATATNTPIRPTATPTPNAQAYTDWLNREVSALESAGVNVLESLYPNGSHNIVWIRTLGLSQSDAKGWCTVVASDYVKQFGAIVTVHFFGPSGLDDELAKCSDQP